MIIINIIIIYFIQIRHTDDFPSTGTRLVYSVGNTNSRFPLGVHLILWDHSVFIKSNRNLPLCAPISFNNGSPYLDLMSDGAINNKALLLPIVFYHPRN